MSNMLVQDIATRTPEQAKATDQNPKVVSVEARGEYVVYFFSSPEPKFNSSHRIVHYLTSYQRLKTMVEALQAEHGKGAESLDFDMWLYIHTIRAVGACAQQVGDARFSQDVIRNFEKSLQIAEKATKRHR